MAIPAQYGELYGKGFHEISDVDVEKSAATGSLVQQLLATFRAPTYQPPVLPAAGVQLLAMSRNPDVDLKKVLAILEKDPMIAGKVMAVARSAAFRAAEPPQTLHQAVMRLGLKTLTEIFLEVSFKMKIFRAPGYEEPMDRVRKHCTATAHVARLICRGTPHDEYAFLCGLLHDIGFAASIIVLAERSKKIEKAPIPFTVVAPAIAETHEQAAEVLSQIWKLPDPVRLAISYHHKLMIEGHLHPLAAVTNVADWVTTRLGYGVDGETASSPPIRAMRFLKISDEMLTKLLLDAKNVLAGVE